MTAAFKCNNSRLHVNARLKLEKYGVDKSIVTNAARQ